MERIATKLPRGPQDIAIHHGARRASHRWPLHADVELLDGSEAVSERAEIVGRGVTINASLGGLRIALDRKLEVGELCALRVRTAKDRETIEHTRVVWVRELPDGWLAGMQFVERH